PTRRGSNLASLRFGGNEGGSLLSIEYPDSEDLEILPNSQIESAVITQLFPNSQNIASTQASKAAVTKALTQNYSILHFTGHAAYNFQRPQNSALFLSGKDKLTLDDIRHIPLKNYQLITLASCETALTGNQTIDNDYVGLVSAFLYQKVRCVVSTLWTVQDNASSLFMMHFYWQLKKGKPPVLALTKTRKWLRNLSDYKLERIYKLIFAKLPKNETTLRPFLRNELNRIKEMNLSQKKQKKFNHPYYWAAFTITSSLMQ
ncbi:MAG: CHAT domain-containing protein, partial [Coleofasciculaceae cyanobacterium]